MIKFTITSTKGGLGKTTLTANLGALLADMGLRLRLIDADVQPSLSKYFPLVKRTPVAGLPEVMGRGPLTASYITPTVYQNLDNVVCDDPQGHLPNGLLNRIDRDFRLRFGLCRAGLLVERRLGMLAKPGFRVCPGAVMRALQASVGKGAQ